MPDNQDLSAGVRAHDVHLSVIIATRDRAGELRGTLESLGRCRFAGSWEVVVVDNGSTDDTPAVIRAAAATLPMDLVHAHEPFPGRSAALNAGIRLARGRIIVTTDDDVRPAVDWLEAACRGLEAHASDYATGRVLPLWPSEPPDWWPATGGVMWGVLGLLDFGADPVPLKGRAPIGVNAAFRREAFDRIGLYNPSVGRKAGTLLGQEVREWHVRARAAGLRGVYLPEMVVSHVIAADRLTKSYFRRWFYWHGISRAILYRELAVDMESPEHTTLDFARVPHLAGTPRYLYRSCAQAALTACRARMRGDRTLAFSEELKVWRFLGFVRQRWRDRHLPVRSSELAEQLRMRNADSSDQEL